MEGRGGFDFWDDVAFSRTVVHDVGVLSIVAPAGAVDSGSSIFPACTVGNFGASPESYRVRMRIGTLYDDTALVTAQAPGTRSHLTFPSWQVRAAPGNYAVTCSTELAGDEVQTNNRLTDSVTVRRPPIHDVSAIRIITPPGTVDSGSFVRPQAKVSNLGGVAESFSIRFRIGSSYSQDAALSGLAAGDSATVSFPIWIAAIGDFVVSCSTMLAADGSPANDRCTSSVRVVSGGGGIRGWTERAAMPLLPSGRTLKDGAWLTFDAGSGLVYAAKGYKTGDFYSYDPAQDTWRQLAFMPAGTENRPPYKGAVGCTDGSGTVYATKGNNTPGFYGYTAATDSWKQLADVPLGTSNKKVKGGADAVYFGGHVYLLKGYKNEFWRYNTATDTWTPLPDAPAGTNPKYNTGSFLVYDGNQTIYCHKSKYHELWRYDLARDTWYPTPLTPMPLLSASGRRRKSKDGGCAAWLGDGFYAFKGANTQEFWKYWPQGDSWDEQETLPSVGSSARKKRVKNGADLVRIDPATILALKGGRVNELWRYTPSLVATRSTPQVVDGVLSRLTRATGAIRIYPNPLGQHGVLSYSLPRPALLQVRLYNAAGRAIRALVPAAVAQGSGTIPLSAQALAPGVYFVRVTAGGEQASVKLVVE
jgi:hypothetical protein